MQTPDFVLEDDIDAALHKAIRDTDVTVNPGITKK